MVPLKLKKKVNILSVQFCSSKYIYTVVQWSPSSIFRLFSSCKMETLYPGNTRSVSPSPAPGNRHSTFYFNEFDHFSNRM